MHKLCWTVALIVFVAPASLNSSLAADGATDVDPSKPNRLLLHYCSADGTPLRPLVSDTQLRHRLDRQGTPEVSADGKRVAFDAWPSSDASAWQESRIVIVDVDGSNAKDIGDGVMPSFSPDGTQLVVSRPPKYAEQDGAAGMSIWTMDIDGQNKKMLADQGAWGARWSPDGRSIVFHGGLDKDGNSVRKSCLRLYDIGTGEIANVFSPAESPYDELSFHFAWSKGNDRTVAVGGPLKGGNGSASATINVDEGIASLVMFKAPADGPQVIHGLSYDWHPNGNEVLMTGIVGGRPFPVSVSTNDAHLPHVFDGIPKDVIVRDPAYTPDGKNLIASFGPFSVN